VTLSVGLREVLLDTVEEASPDLLGFSASKKVGPGGLKNDFGLGRLKASASGSSLFFSLTENQRLGGEVASGSIGEPTRLGADENGSKTGCWPGAVVRNVARC